MKIFVLLYWFYEGDSNLVDSFIDVFSSYEKALEYKNLTDEENLEILNADEIDKMCNGSYDNPSFYEIRECEVK